MLADYTQVKTLIGIPSADTSQDAKIQLLLQAADGAVKKYCKRAFETNAQYTWYPPETRLGGEAIVVPETPLLCYIQQGTVVSGQATITGLPSTSNLLAGMTAILAPGVNNRATQPFPNAATIASINSSSQVTMSGNASYGGALNFLFGCSLWYDPNGSFGAGTGTDPSGPYGAITLLFPGIDYAIQRDQADGTSGSGKLVRLHSAFGFLGMGGAWNPYGSSWGGLNTRGTLTAPLKPLWPNWPPGSVRVLYAAGLGTGATPPAGLMPSSTTLPTDLTAATALLTAWMWRNADTGGMLVTNESFGGYSGAIAPAIDALKQDSELGSIRQILSRYRRLSIG